MWSTGGGAGAGPGWNGESGIQVHMTNTRCTDVEILERRYPVLLNEFSIREGSGGKGRWDGGDGKECNSAWFRLIPRRT